MLDFTMTVTLLMQRNLKNRSVLLDLLRNALCSIITACPFQGLSDHTVCYSIIITLCVAVVYLWCLREDRVDRP
jgi:hypothetical protein